MDKKNCIRKIKEATDRKDIVMSIRANLKQSKFMEDNKFSPQLIFEEALKELGFK
jgi:hypothetical protein